MYHRTLNSRGRVSWSAVLFSAIFISSFLPCLSSSVTTVGGNGLQGFVEGNLSVAKFSDPYAVVMGADGDIYVTDTNNHRIRKINQTKAIIETFAGTGVAGFVDGQANVVQFNLPKDMQMGPDGNLYAVDTNNHCIRQINPNGTVSTLAGTGLAGFADGVSSAAKFNAPQGLSIDIDSGNIYVADTGNHKIRKLEKQGDSWIVSTLAGNGIAGFADGTANSAKFNTPIDVVFDSGTGSLYVSDNKNHRIRKIAPINLVQTVSTVAGAALFGDVDGLAIDAKFRNPTNIILDPTHNILYISDSGNKKIKKLDLSNLTVNTVAGTGSNGYADGDFSGAGFSDPRGIAIDQTTNDLIIADRSNYCIRRLALEAPYTVPKISTITGTNRSGYTDGSREISKLKSPNGIVVDSFNNIYFADTGNHLIRMISPDGSVSTIAGTGVSGFNDGDSTTAQFYSPKGLAKDSEGNIYVADSSNNAIRKMQKQGNTWVVSTVAGNGNPGLTDGSALSAQFKSPTGLTVDQNNNIYVADYNNHSIRLIDTNGTVSTIAGSGSPGLANGQGINATFKNPSDVKIDNNGNLYVADCGNHAIRKIMLIEGVWVVTTYTGGTVDGFIEGYALQAAFSFPFGIVIDTNNNIYVADQNNYRIRKISSNLNNSKPMVTTVAGNGISGFRDGSFSEASFAALGYLALDNTGSLIVSDTGNHRIRKISAELLELNDLNDTINNANSTTLAVTTIAGTGALGYRDGVQSVGLLNKPQGVAVDSHGNIYVADTNNHRIRKVDTENSITSIAGTGIASLNDGPGYAAGFQYPKAIVADANDRLFVSDYGNHVIKKMELINDTWQISTIAGTGASGHQDGPGSTAQFNGPIGLAVDLDNNLYVADYNNHKIRKITYTNGDWLVSTIAGSSQGYVDGIADTAKFNKPFGIAVDNNKNIYVSDQNNHRIRKISEQNTLRTVSTFAGGGAQTYADGLGTEAQFYYPGYITVDSNANLYVSDVFNNRIRKINSDGLVTSFAGNGLPGFVDNSLDKVSFNRPAGIVINSQQEIIISDSENNRVRKIASVPVIEPITIIINSPPPPAPPPQTLPATNSGPVIKLLKQVRTKDGLDDTNDELILNLGENNVLRVFVFDLEDGQKIENSVVWKSDVQGELTTGLSLNTSELRKGNHNIVVRVTDSKGLNSSIRFLVKIIDGGKGIGPSNLDNVVLSVKCPETSKFRRGQGFNLKAIALSVDQKNNDNTSDISDLVTWTSDLDGVLGEGSKIKIRTGENGLGRGKRVITASIGSVTVQKTLNIGHKVVTVCE